MGTEQVVFSFFREFVISLRGKCYLPYISSLRYNTDDSVIGDRVKAPPIHTSQPLTLSTSPGFEFLISLLVTFILIIFYYFTSVVFLVNC